MSENELPEWFVKAIGEKMQQAVSVQLAPLIQQIQQAQEPLADYLRNSVARMNDKRRR